MTKLPSRKATYPGLPQFNTVLDILLNSLNNLNIKKSF